MPKRDRFGREYDLQRSRVYKAEREAFKPFGKPTMTRDEVIEFMSGLTADRHIRDTFGETEVSLQFWGRNRHSAAYYADANYIRLPRWGYSAHVLLHEYAHRLQEPHAPNAAGHGPEFTAILQWLVDYRLGEATGTRLYVAFRDHRVKQAESVYDFVKGSERERIN